MINLKFINSVTDIWRGYLNHHFSLNTDKHRSSYDSDENTVSGTPLSFFVGHLFDKNKTDLFAKNSTSKESIGLPASIMKDIDYFNTLINLGHRFCGHRTTH